MKFTFFYFNSVFDKYFNIEVPLHIVVGKRNAYIVKCLLEKEGIDVNSKQIFILFYFMILYYFYF